MMVVIFHGDFPFQKPPFLDHFGKAWLSTGWWLGHPSENMNVNWDDYSQYMENKIDVPNHQPDTSM